MLAKDVRTKRGNKEIAFIALNDGSTINNIQIVVDKAAIDPEILSKITTGACIAVKGKLVESPAAGRRWGDKRRPYRNLWECDPVRFPLQRKTSVSVSAHGRSYAPAPVPWRHSSNPQPMAFAIHEYAFTARASYICILPIITAADAEGAGNMFQVTTLPLDNVPKNKKESPITARTSSAGIPHLR